MKKHQSQQDDGMSKGASAHIFRNAEKLRENMTEAELVLWEYLKQKKFHGLKFRRQHPIQTYIADFYCHKCRLIIELDGEYHLSQDQVEYDTERTEVLNFTDVNVLRFTNDEVMNNINKVLLEIKKFINNN